MADVDGKVVFDPIAAPPAHLAALVVADGLEETIQVGDLVLCASSIEARQVLQNVEVEGGLVGVNLRRQAVLGADVIVEAAADVPLVEHASVVVHLVGGLKKVARAVELASLVGVD